MTEYHPAKQINNISKVLSITFFGLFKSQKQSQSGFTIIELLVVFTITTILAGIGIASFVSYSRSEQVNQSAGNIKLLINEAKFNSLSVVKSVSNETGQKIGCGNANLVGYTIDVISPDKITLTQVCDEVSPPNRTFKTTTLPSGVTIASAAPLTNCSKVSFGSLSAVVSGVPCSIKINGFGSLTKTITIDIQGNAKVN